MLFSDILHILLPTRLVTRSPILPATGGMRVEAWVASQSTMKLNGSFAASGNSTPRNHHQMDYNALSLLPRYVKLNAKS